jgi:hypothetical protein
MVSLIENAGMKFKSWLEAEPNRQTDMRQHLGCSESQMSNVKNGNKPFPRAWIRPVVEYTKGAVSYEDLLPKRSTRKAKQ